MIVPCSLDIAKSLIFHRKELEKRSPIEIPSYWPTSVVRGFIPYYIESIENLEADEKDLDCGFWLIILYEQKKIIGDLLMQGKPKKEGLVELSYHIDEEDIDETIAYEAIDAFIDWLTYQQAVKKIIIECEVLQQKKIKLYNKLGFICVKKDGDFLTWEMQKKGE